MDVMEAIYTRRAVRAYSSVTLDDGTLTKLIDAAIQAPSAVNEQPWAFCVVRDKALLARISSASKSHMLRTTPAALLSHHFEQILNDERFNIFYDAPALVVISSRVDSHWAVEDCALAAENLMLAARALGLGSCWIGFAQAWLATSEGKAALSIPESYRPLAPIIVGQPASDPPAVARKAPEISWIG